MPVLRSRTPASTSDVSIWRRRPGLAAALVVFIAELAFADQPALRDIATVAVFIASAVAAIIALLLGRRLPSPPVAVAIAGAA